ncbi:phage baseplate assembly protein V [Paucibacter sp. KBW04]|uniref:phage baseplate assembly protein V n=1 Tax=Paucibacter sp. KBW04 TaxID=2153361 RepID=UPI000F5833EC|nr:phage baseplate assembly protein V [Paucibacter sp. KBW04]RQO63114.1 phage baseplate assembly protein V [Paucibacter sp. KBW04]
MQAFQRMLRPLTQRIQLMVGRAVLQLVDDSTKLQSVQIMLLADELRDQVERFQNYGFTSVPLPGAEAVAVAVAGNRDHALVIAVDDRRYRLKGLASGEVAIYTDEGDKVHIKRGGTIEVVAATRVYVSSPLVECSGDMTVHGKLLVDGNIDSGATITAEDDVRDQGGTKTMRGMRDAFNPHKHGTGPGPDRSM